MFAGDEKKRDEDDTRTSPILGKQVYKTSKSLDRAKAAMFALYKDVQDRIAGLPMDPAPCSDFAKKRVQIDRFALCRFARGKFKGRYAVVDESLGVASEGRLCLLKETTFKMAVAAFIALANRRKSAPKSKRYVGAPIAFEVPGGFGGGGGFNGFTPYAERSYPEPGSVSWRVAVDRFAQTGRWCRSAEYPTGRPAALEQQGREARDAWLVERALGRATEADDPVALEAMDKLAPEDNILLNDMLERVDGALVTLELPDRAGQHEGR